MTERPDPELVEAFGRVVRRRFEEQITREHAAAEARRAVVLPLVRTAVARARAEGLCGQAWLFGSYAWGQPGERSDVDLLADACVDPFQLASVVGRACGLDVHVIDRRNAPPALIARAETEGLAV